LTTDPIILDDNEWTIEATIDKVQRNLAAVEQHVTNKAGAEILPIRKYQSQCRDVEAVGIEPYMSIGRKLIVKLIKDYNG
jgi:hypothetical protein